MTTERKRLGRVPRGAIHLFELPRELFQKKYK